MTANAQVRPRKSYDAPGQISNFKQPGVIVKPDGSCRRSRPRWRNCNYCGKGYIGAKWRGIWTSCKGHRRGSRIDGPRCHLRGGAIEIRVTGIDAGEYM